MNEKVITPKLSLCMIHAHIRKKKTNAPEHQLILNKSFNQRDLVIAQSLIHDDVI